MEEMGDEVLVNGSDPKSRARVAHRFFPGDGRALNGTRDEEYLNVFGGNLHIRVERRCENPLYCDPYEYPAPECRIVETDLRTGRKLIYRIELEKMVDAE